MKSIELEVYRHLFSSVAEEMGAVLMRSSFSPNIKERRDFSCAIFDARGEMVAQAAHIPVHLGSTPMSVAAAMASVEMEDGVHVILNDPYAGGTHLPDITLVSPVYVDDELRFFVANRAHHADVGGGRPGSLAVSEYVDDEGIRIGPTVWSEEVVERIASASRTPQERRGDLRAQWAANQRGIRRLSQEMAARGPALVEAAQALQDHGESYMKAALAEMPHGQWSFEDALEGDGYEERDIPIAVTLSLGPGRGVVDFHGSADQVRGPLNVPRAVTVSAALYCFRCLMGPELPTNGGYMRCVEVRTPAGSVVDARPPAPVALGNVETSQRITDVVLGAMAKAMPERIPAASCGTMNNLTIGGIGADGEAFAYYETIGGGSGAGPTYDGAHGVQTHMTNTLNTPVEALERAYPFRVEAYERRRDSGGEGARRGGDGVRRRYVFEAAAEVTIMAERRRLRPYGLQGGAPGAPGAQWRVGVDGVKRPLPAKGSVEVEAGDEVIIETPGGGGWGDQKRQRTPSD